MMDTAGALRWRRSIYPLQIPLEDVPRFVSKESSKEEGDESSVDRLQTNTQAINGPAGHPLAGKGDGVEQQSSVSQLMIDTLQSHGPSEDVQANYDTCPVVRISRRSTLSTSSSRDSNRAQGTSSLVQLRKSNPNHESRMLSSWTRSLYPSGAMMDTTIEPHSSELSLALEEKHEPKTNQEDKTDESETGKTTSPSRQPSSPVLATSARELSPEVRAEEDAESAATSITSSWTRHVYPLQSTANSSLMRHPPTPPPEKESRLVHRTRSDQHEDGKKSFTDNGIQAPPNDSPQSPNNHFTTLAESSSSSRRGSENALETPRNQHHNCNQVANESKTWHRQKYPLQASAIYANAQDRLTPPPSPKREPEHVRNASVDKSRENDQYGPKSTTFRRQLYPLQSLAWDTSIQPSTSSSLSVEKGLQETDKSFTLHSSENTLATKVINQWRRQVYPLQSFESEPHVQPSPTLQTLEAEAEKKYPPTPVHLPKNIPAVTDANKHDSKGRTIVVCLDGTGDKFDSDNSNIVHLISALKKDDARQMTYYQAGVGTYGASGLSGGVTAAMDMAVGSSLGLHVRDAYHFLMHTYKEGDRICIFGFSRGAYTARCLAGMIHKVGLLPPRNIQQISFAYEFYKRESPEGWKQSAEFKKTFSIDISVYFLGCFDSVASVGIIPRQLPLSSTPTNKPRYFRHAMALDERRAKFKVCRHEEKDWGAIDAVFSLNATANPAQSDLLSFSTNRTTQSDTPPPGLRYGKPNHPNLTDEEHKRLTADEVPFETDVLEVWFAGAHADIGGGAVSNDERHKLAQIPLRWMIRQAFECNTGILFKTAVLAEYGLDVHMLWPKYDRHNVPKHGPSPSFLRKYENGLPPKAVRRSKLVPTDKQEKGEQLFHLRSHTDEDWTPEQVEDFFDAMSPLNDQLVQAPSWWILEVLPIQCRIPAASGEVSTRLAMNLGRYRGVEEKEPKVHWTVSHRMQHVSYKIEAGAPLRINWQTVA